MNTSHRQFAGCCCRRAGIAGLAASVLVSMSGCANVQALERPYPVAVPMPPAVAERFACEAGGMRAELTPVRENSTYLVVDGRFESGIAGSEP